MWSIIWAVWQKCVEENVFLAKKRAIRPFRKRDNFLLPKAETPSDIRFCFRMKILSRRKKRDIIKNKNKLRGYKF